MGKTNLPLWIIIPIWDHRNDVARTVYIFSIANMYLESGNRMAFRTQAFLISIFTNIKQRKPKVDSSGVGVLANLVQSPFGSDGVIVLRVGDVKEDSIGANGGRAD